MDKFGGDFWQRQIFAYPTHHPGQVYTPSILLFNNNRVLLHAGIVSEGILLFTDTHPMKRLKLP
jgi:hypothetical protein